MKNLLHTWIILLSPANGEGVKTKADALGASKLMIIGGTGVMPDTTVQAAVTGIIPKKPLTDMTLAEMRANYPLAYEKGKNPDRRAGAMLEYCVGHQGYSIFLGESESLSYLGYREKEPMKMTVEKYMSKFGWTKDYASEYWNTLIGANNDPTVLYGNNAFGVPVVKYNGGDVWHDKPSQCRKGAEHPEWAKPFPVGKRIEGGNGSLSYSCAADETSGKCFAWGTDFIEEGYLHGTSESNPTWFWVADD